MIFSALRLKVIFWLLAKVVTYLYGHYQQKGCNATSKAYELDNPYALSLCIRIIELIVQNGSDVDFIDNINLTFSARMFRMPADDNTV